MGFRLRPTSSCTRASSLHNLQVLLSLLLIALAPLAVGKPDNNEPFIELRCRCTTAISGIPLNSISRVNVFRPGAHCDNVEVIATLKNGKEVCLDPTAPMIKKIVKKILEGY
ncbi:permeability factor 2-like [Rattus rattus]|uniref:permeability factor 2-like n=1 Tax=Rattus rattus TaxID=10117 RepID=UPI0013F376FA|nr:permeability factor 2-like [Rattus rattus]